MLRHKAWAFCVNQALTTSALCAVIEQVEKNTIWTFEQTQALELFNVYIPVRMTVIKLKSGGGRCIYV